MTKCMTPVCVNGGGFGSNGSYMMLRAIKERGSAFTGRERPEANIVVKMAKWDLKVKISECLNVRMFKCPDI